MQKLLGLALLMSFTQVYARIPVEPKVAWDKSSIRVCFGNDTHKIFTFAIHDKSDFINYSTDQKKWIKEIITKEYQLKESGMEFVGWEDCNDRASNGDVVLLRYEPTLPDGEETFSESGGRATIGQRGVESSNRDGLNITTYSYVKSELIYLNFVALNTRAARDKRIGAENFLKMTALHEFGHTAGLRHQHVRLKEALADSNCKRQRDIKLSQEPIFSTTIFTGPYDYNSVMNYCYLNTMTANTGLNFRAKSLDDIIKLTDETLYTTKYVTNVFGQKRLEINLRVGLSALDKHALKCLYLFDEETKKERCHYPQ